MRAGKLRHRLKIESPVRTRDSHKGFKNTWVEFDERWGDVAPLNGKEIFQADKVKGLITHKVTMRHVEGLTTSMRFLFKERILNIARVPINLEERNIEHEVFCIEEI